MPREGMNITGVNFGRLEKEGIDNSKGKLSIRNQWKTAAN